MSILRTTEQMRAVQEQRDFFQENLSKEARKTLREAAEYISEHGWTQGKYARMEGVCALGAIGMVTNSLAWINTNELYPKIAMQPTYIMQENMIANVACELLVKHIGHHPEFKEGPQLKEGMTISYWNDMPERTKEDVILALKRAGEEPQ